MEPRIETLPEKTFIGQHLVMSFANIRTAELWRGFMPRRKEIANVIGADLYSMAVYAPGFFAPFDPQREFQKWAAVEVSDAADVPTGMSVITASGEYAVFLHKGPASEGPVTFRYIFGTWLPASRYEPDQRPHFEIMTAKYAPDAADPEEELWIPVRPKA